MSPTRTERLLAALDTREPARSTAELLRAYPRDAHPGDFKRRQGDFFRFCLERMVTPIGEDELIVGGLPYREAASNRCLLPSVMTDAEASERAALARERYHARTGRPAPDLRPGEEGAFFASVNHGHIIADYGHVLRVGYDGLRAQIAARRAQAQDADTLAFLDSADLCLAGCQAHMRNYAAQAERLAAHAHGLRRAELEAIAQVCQANAHAPAATFHEAVQLVWFTQLFMEMESGLSAFSYGRMDQYLAPFYEGDLQAGRLTPEQAQQLLDCFYIKNGQYPSRIGDPGRALTIGGVRADGCDGTNPLSYMILDCLARIPVFQPKLNARLHAGSPEGFFRACCWVARGNIGPMLYWDESVIPSLMRYGYRFDEACDYGLIGCYEYGLAGMERPSPMGCGINLGKCLELALWDGRDPRTGAQLGPHTGLLTDHAAYEDLEAAFLTQFAHIADRVADQLALEEARTSLLRPQPLLSSLVAGCIDSGRDIADFGARYSSVGIRIPGIAAVADSLAALRTLCFQQGRFSRQRVLDALGGNFASDPVLRAALIHQAPKYGNDLDEVDDIARRVCQQLCRIVSGHIHLSGMALRPGLFSFQDFMRFGQACDALPNGRLAGEPFVNGVSPAHGMDRQGPTAMFNSAAKLDYSLSNNASTLDFKVSPSLFAGPQGEAHLMALIRSYFERGGMQVQLYFLDADQLRQAREQPERYPSLTVRVTGYSAYFTQLPPDLQEEVIARTASL